MTEQRYFRKGFKMREDVQHLLDRDYRSEAVDRVRENGNALSVEGLSERKLLLGVKNTGETPAGKIWVELMSQKNAIIGAPVELTGLDAGAGERIRLPLEIGKKAKGTIAAWAVVRAEGAPAAAVRLRINVDAGPILASP